MYGLFQFLFLAGDVHGGLEVLESIKSGLESVRGGCSQEEKAEHRPGPVAAASIASSTSFAWIHPRSSFSFFFTFCTFDFDPVSWIPILRQTSLDLAVEIAGAQLGWWRPMPSVRCRVWGTGDRAGGGGNCYSIGRVVPPTDQRREKPGGEGKVGCGNLLLTGTMHSYRRWQLAILLLQIMS
jgi:hypothetical protein